jgi:nitroreductase
MDFSMPLDEAMRTQRAIRILKPDPVDDVLVLRLIELALKAPSGSNQQNWEFVIVKNRAVKEKLGALNRGMFRFYGGLGRRMAQNQPKMLRILDAVQRQTDHFAEVPVVVACLRCFRAAWPPIIATSYYGSIYPSVQNLLRRPCRRSRRGAHHDAALEHVSRGERRKPALCLSAHDPRGHPRRMKIRPVVVGRRAGTVSRSAADWCH